MDCSCHQLGETCPGCNEKERCAQMTPGQQVFEQALEVGEWIVDIPPDVHPTWDGLPESTKRKWEDYAERRASKLPVCGVDMASGPGMTATEVLRRRDEQALAWAERPDDLPMPVIDRMFEIAKGITQYSGNGRMTSFTFGEGPLLTQTLDSIAESEWKDHGKPTGAFRQEDAKGYVKPVSRVTPAPRHVAGEARDMQAALSVSALPGTHLLGTKDV